MYDRDDSAPALLSFLIGGIVGATAACLLATRSGPQLRRLLRERLDAGAARVRIPRALERPDPAVPEPGLPADMGRGERG
jgi:hypothetical protein